MTGASPAEGLAPADLRALIELAPVLRRTVTLDAKSLARLRLRDNVASVLVRLPFGVLVARTIEAAGRAKPIDVVVAARDALDWVDDVRPDPPEPRDAEWRSARPPDSGWAAVDSVPDHVVRPLVRSGALTLEDAAQREGVPGAQPRAEVTDALLDSVVLTVRDDDRGTSAEVNLRSLSALTRMGFLPRGGRIRVDVAGRWIRVVAEYGTVYLEQPGSALTLR